MYQLPLILYLQLTDSLGIPPLGGRDDTLHGAHPPYPIHHASKDVHFHVRNAFPTTSHVTHANMSTARKVRW